MIVLKVSVAPLYFYLAVFLRSWAVLDGWRSVILLGRGEMERDRSLCVFPYHSIWVVGMKA